MIEYQKILDKNMINVFKDILKNIKKMDYQTIIISILHF